jgi:hypothetical protein
VNRKNILYVMAGIMGLLIVNAGSAQEYAAQRAGEADSISLTRVRIESREARAFLKSETISVRARRTSFVPKGELPIPRLETIDDNACRERLGDVMRRHFSDKQGAGNIKKRGEVFAVRAGSASSWIHRGSGSYKVTEAKQSMAVRQTKGEDFKKAVQLALYYIGKHQLVEMAEGEEMNVLFVSGVKNALATVQEEKPVDEFLSDYYVGFGRRFKGVPVIGSRLVIRLNGNGDVVMVERNWRRITAVSEQKAVVSNKSLPELMIKAPDFRERYDAKDVSPKDITIADAQCGYVEAPLDYVQDSLRPGCSVSFFIGKLRDETLPQMFVPLEEEGTVGKLLGSKYRERKTEQ